MKRILAIGAHPDDIEFGCAGFIQKASESKLIVLSQGERGGKGRRKEALRAAKHLGSNIEVYSFADTLIQPKDIIPIIEKEILDFKPTIILTMAQHDTHQDHRAVYEATKVAIREVSCTVLSYMGPSSAEWFKPTWFVPLNEKEHQVKLEAISFHQSQKHRKYLTEDYVKITSRYWAMITRSQEQYVEPYEVIQHWEQ